MSANVQACSQIKDHFKKVRWENIPTALLDSQFPNFMLDDTVVKGHTAYKIVWAMLTYMGLIWNTMYPYRVRAYVL